MSFFWSPFTILLSLSRAYRMAVWKTLSQHFGTHSKRRVYCSLLQVLTDYLLPVTPFNSQSKVGKSLLNPFVILEFRVYKISCHWPITKFLIKSLALTFLLQLLVVRVVSSIAFETGQNSTAIYYNHSISANDIQLPPERLFDSSWAIWGRHSNWVDSWPALEVVCGGGYDEWLI